jgi:hypothetical protein
MKKKQFGALFLLPAIVTTVSQSLKQATSEERMRKELEELNAVIDSCKTAKIDVPNSVIKQANTLTSRLMGAELDKVSASPEVQKAGKALALEAVKTSAFLKGAVLTFTFDAQTGETKLSKVAHDVTNKEAAE